MKFESVVLESTRAWGGGARGPAAGGGVPFGRGVEDGRSGSLRVGTQCNG